MRPVTGVRHGLAPALPPAVDGELRFANGRSGRLGFYVAGDGAPLLLLHSINAAGSAYEVRPIFERYRATRRVYAPDLPGFGSSDRSPRAYDVRLYVDAIHDLLDTIELDVGATPVDALALSLSSEFLARAATRRPGRFRSLALIAPTGFDAGSDELREPEGRTREVPLLHSLLTAWPWRRTLYGLLTRPGTIRYFLRRTFGSSDIDEGLATYDVLTSQQPGAEHAPYAFVCGRLFSRDIRNVYESLSLPVWLAHGTRGDFVDYRGADWVRGREAWRVRAFETGALPHFEVPEEFFGAYDDFLGAVTDPVDGPGREP